MPVVYALRVTALASGLLSLVFTIRFILFLGGSDDASIDVTVWILLIVSGVVVEAGKCLCWYTKRHSLPHVIFGIVLTSFSCAASVAFCTLQETDLIETQRKATAEYIAYRTKETQLVNQIASKEARRKKHLSSAYHDQWDNAAKLEQKIDQLTVELVQLRRTEKTVGKAEAEKSVKLMVMFGLVAKAVGWPIHYVKYTAYFLFSFVIEVMPVFMLTGMLIEKKDTNEKLKNTTDQQSDQKGDQSALIKRAIILEQVPPATRNLIQRYGIYFNEAKGILEQLKNEGFLRKYGNIYKLNKSITQSTASQKP
ncbi:hypothetical protein [Teredinibacter haidensis]|uniref:hypothetical protein n=1 Tax=Teredinibacter haidensis TaxID=2731755 RepID=UPI000948AB74|nr:hypothetical protein [Teredinibacter haidensis]